MLMTTPIEQTAALTIGTVESVSPSEIKVLLELDAPQAMALNTGAPHGFPRINGYVLIPNEAGALVGMIVWLGIERSPFPKRTGMKDFGLVDLPFPLRKLVITPLGTLVHKKDTVKYNLILERGVAVFPTVGDPVLLPTRLQLKSIVEAANPSDRRVSIGSSPLASNANVTVDPNRIFGRHLAVLGNTGSGKSCSVAGLIRWSLEAAKEERKQEGRDDSVNARFIILDPNGEYSTAFKDLIEQEKARVFHVPPVEEGSEELVLPSWMWNSHEWCAFTEASSRVQRPVLMRALRELRATADVEGTSDDVRLYVLLRSFYRSLVNDRNKPAAYMEKPGKNDFGQKLHAIAVSLAGFAKGMKHEETALDQLAARIKEIADSKLNTFRNDDGEEVTFYHAFATGDVDDAIEAIKSMLETLPVPRENLGISADSPVSFDAEALASLIEQIAVEQGQTQHVDTLLLRVKMLLSDQHLKPVVSPATPQRLESWLERFIGGDPGGDRQIAILDLSLIPSEALHTIMAVTARIVFEATQRYRRMNTKELPTVLVLEEAHTFVRRGSDQEEGNPTPPQMCRQTFERIAREGRKFGLGLVLSSQRPSELSPTVLAQCNTFLLHRIVNDRDQELIGRLVPDNLAGLLKELPSLSSRQAIFLGWAVSVPVLVEITELPEEHRPSSSDPRFWEVWTGEEERPIDWKKIADDWSGLSSATEPSESRGNQEGRNAEEPMPEDDVPF